MIYAACILWTVLLAIWSAADDAEQIRNNERLNKALQWCLRAFGVTALCVACGMWWMALPMGALFSMVFRFVLNRMRGLDWRYVSPSSWYDWQFMRLGGGFGDRNAVIEDFAKDYRDGNTDLGEYVREITHRAGLLAYIAELAFAVLIFVLFV